MDTLGNKYALYIYFQSYKILVQKYNNFSISCNKFSPI